MMAQGKGDRCQRFAQNLWMPKMHEMAGYVRRLGGRRRAVKLATAGWWWSAVCSGARAAGRNVWQVEAVRPPAPTIVTASLRPIPAEPRGAGPTSRGGAPAGAGLRRRRSRNAPGLRAARGSRDTVKCRGESPAARGARRPGGHDYRAFLASVPQARDRADIEARIAVLAPSPDLPSPSRRLPRRNHAQPSPSRPRPRRRPSPRSGRSRSSGRRRRPTRMRRVAAAPDGHGPCSACWSSAARSRLRNVPAAGVAAAGTACVGGPVLGDSGPGGGACTASPSWLG